MNRFFEKKKKLKITIMSALILIAVLAGGFYIYTLDYYKADDGVADMEALKNAEHIDNLTIFYPEGDAGQVGIIFYPGGKVEAIAYAPLLYKLSEKGFTCVLIKMPMNLAVFNINGADKVYDKFPEIKKWYLMGHSLGGAMASSYCEKNSDRLKGLILLGAYPVNDADIDTLVIYGSEDINLDLEKLEGLDNVIRLEGGNHAYFGNYGEQKGDGKAKITRQQQQEIAVRLIAEFVGSR